MVLGGFLIWIQDYWDAYNLASIKLTHSCKPESSSYAAALYTEVATEESTFKRMHTLLEMLKESTKVKKYKTYAGEA